MGSNAERGGKHKEAADTVRRFLAKSCRSRPLAGRRHSYFFAFFAAFFAGFFAAFFAGISHSPLSTRTHGSGSFTFANEHAR